MPQIRRLAGGRLSTRPQAHEASGFGARGGRSRLIVPRMGESSPVQGGEMRQFAHFRIRRPGRVGTLSFIILRKLMRKNLLIICNVGFHAFGWSRRVAFSHLLHSMTLRRASFSTLMQVSLQNVDDVTIFRNFRFQRFNHKNR
ncbi:hypothetical protein GIY62_31870 [Burkholderia plantarii]|uniref:hypothetical protein n=1 Tax=Burkholderia plantarii TaxID=41899 RepID=UPI00272C05EB|nr:hypothetical protein [Burkholderia plantarii]WLE62009.1 hypothetical protein GIY62_31870 [Burkholderia plantarii]